VVHELYEDPEVVDAVAARWGPEVVADGRVDRARLADRAFATAEGRAWLEELLWPRVGARVAGWREEAAAQEPPPRAAVVEVPLLFESGMEGLFDATVAVVAPEAVRAERAGARGHASVDERHARQLPQDEKARRAGHVAENAGDVSDLEQRLAEILDVLSPRSVAS